jgi:hypothetical protein
LLNGHAHPISNIDVNQFMLRSPMKYLLFTLLLPTFALANYSICNRGADTIENDNPGSVKDSAPLNNKMFKRLKNKKGYSLLLRKQCLKRKCEYTLHIIAPKAMHSPKYEEVYYENHFGKYNVIASDNSLSSVIFAGDYATEYALKNVYMNKKEVRADIISRQGIVQNNVLVGLLDSTKPFFSGKKSGNLVFPGFPGGRVTYKAKYWIVTPHGQLESHDYDDVGDIRDLEACLHM